MQYVISYGVSIESLEPEREVVAVLGKREGGVVGEKERERERGREVVRAAVNCAERAGWRRECCGVMLSALQGGTEVGG